MNARSCKMMNILEDGESVTIYDVLKNKDQRVELQNKLVLENKNWTIIGAKLNIPGPIKNNLMIENFFKYELVKFESNAPFVLTLEGNFLKKKTGPEYFYLAQEKPVNVKEYCIDFEQENKARRLFDLDVHYFKNNQIKDLGRAELGILGRGCLICGKPAKECARSRAHSVEELQKQISELIIQELSF
ncbi:citrate lyase holo-[acyl-carrier protein] synthase [Lactobacillus jensenii]|uniref:citrate lyase holo-[acyl-carrier protein] synthase n=6 Tax=Lactobacillus jensenii TaxID=109790 RepID=A0A5N1IDE5_LACJE|nr:holo-ACP synthase CitX [Lactobacillus jensenii]EEQ68607.1 holo-ACP synthase CitX [Lactobacillus jensenii 1153]EEX27774.1 holo-ACP synthase CitX [Lactobacillus jensenii SJ-7A-US]KAA9236543.1 citrate lyase holo-[acyl-carrier protein] synthase [Lactobacillus jensenii]KAA9259976.1 citrate lyase holo-[acyl-carrier protein] synthase [Lactobacillus jensenii]